MFLLSLPMRGAWIEMTNRAIVVNNVQSLPMRGAWIEMCIYHSNFPTLKVAPHAGSVD